MTFIPYSKGKTRNVTEENIYYKKAAILYLHNYAQSQTDYLFNHIWIQFKHSCLFTSTISSSESDYSEMKFSYHGILLRFAKIIFREVAKNQKDLTE